MEIETKSHFIRIKCGNCGNEQIAFDHSSRELLCKVCGDTLIKPSGGKSEVRGEVIEILE